MINSLYQSQHTEPPQRADKNWFVMEKKRDLLLPVSVDTARERLKSVLASSITEHKGLLFARTKYTGRIDGDNLEIQYTSYGKGTTFYRIHGRLFDDPRGSRLEMTIRDRHTWRLIFPPLFAFVICAIFSAVIGLRGLALLTTVLVVGTCLAVILGVITFLLAAWHRSVATDSVAAMLLKIVTGRPLN